MQQFIGKLAMGRRGKSLLGLGAIASIMACFSAPATASGVGQHLMQVWGILENGDATLSDNSLFDKHWFMGQAGQTVTITLTSHDFDTYLIVYDANGDRLAQNDDITETDKNSSVTLTLPTDGRYRIVANAYSDLGYGHYKLTVVTFSEQRKPDLSIADTIDADGNLADVIFEAF